MSFVGDLDAVEYHSIWASASMHLFWPRPQ